MAVSLVFLLAVKILIPRFFPKLGKNLFLLGIGVYLISFTLVVITGGYYLIRRLESAPYISHAKLASHMLDEKLGKELFIEKCSTCHVLENIMKPRSAEAWEKVVNDMVVLAGPRITRDEGGQILHYLTVTHVPNPLTEPDESSLMQKHCLPCHDATEIFAKRYNRTAWTEIVKQMNQYDAELVPAENIDEIVDFLLKNQQNE
jgi:cytochrome c5